MRGISWPPETKAEALKVIEREGNIERAHRETGIPRNTLWRWAEAAGIAPKATAKHLAQTEKARVSHEANVALRRAELRDRLIETAHDMIDRMSKPHVDFKGKDGMRVEYPIAPAEAVRNYAISLAVLIDKYRLEVGEVTGRTEFRKLTDDLDDHEKQTLRDWIDSLDVDALPGDAAGDPSGAGSEVR